MAATKVREIMTSDPRCVSTDDSFQKAAELMAGDQAGALPICGQDGRLKGVLTDRDIVVRGPAGGKRLDEPAGGLNQGKTVTVGADDSVDEAMATMVEKRVERLPVIDGTTLVGMVTTGDVARALPDPEVGELVEALSVDQVLPTRGLVANRGAGEFDSRLPRPTAVRRHRNCH